MNQFKCYPKRKAQEYISIVSVCRCGHYDTAHNYEIEKISDMKYEAVHYNCKECTCQKFKEITKMTNHDYYKFNKRFELRLAKLASKMDSINRESQLVSSNFILFCKQFESTTSKFKIKTDCKLIRMIKVCIAIAREGTGIDAQ